MAAEFALDTLYTHFHGGSNSMTFTDHSSAPLFVTWDKKGELRGCIGTFAPQRLIRGIPKYALIAALEDSRFPPIREKEFKNLECHVTLLRNFEDITKDPFNWDIGVHGIQLELLDRGLSSTFLPSVMTEQGWNKEETFDYLIRKAGTRGKLEDFNYKVTRYTGDKDSMSAKDYLKKRNL